MSARNHCLTHNVTWLLSAIFACLLCSSTSAAIDAHTPLSNPNRPIRILALDSGGIHGIISTHSLIYLEKKSGKPINELFDMIVCVSTGAVQTTLLTIPDANHKPLYSAEQLLAFYDGTVANMLRPSLWWRISSLQGLLKPQLDSEQVYQVIQTKTQDLKLSDLLNHVIILTYDLRNQWLLKFDSLQAKQSLSKNFMLTDVIYGAISAPSKIAPREVTNLAENKKYMFMDGGIINSDPAMLALLIAANIYPDNPKYMLSLGNGKAKTLINFEKISNWGLLDWAIPLTDILFNVRNNTTQKIISIFYYHHFSHLKFYLRVDPLLTYTVNSSFAGTRKEVRILNQIGEKTVQQYQSQLDFFTQPLEKMIEQSELSTISVDNTVKTSVQNQLPNDPSPNTLEP